MKKFCCLFFLLIIYAGFAQDKPQNTGINDSLSGNRTGPNLKDRAMLGKKSKDDAMITDYRIISHHRDTSYFDTTLTIQKDYKYNYLRKDDFELLPFSNLGQTYNTLAHQFNSPGIYPQIGARAKHFNYMETEEINYYYVPTPITELFFKTAMEQGQLLDAFIAVNTSPQFNFSIAYKGLRSLGKYQHILSSTGNFRFTANYQSRNKKYRLRGHVVTQDLLNQENGGVENEIDFETEGENEEFRDRSRIPVLFENAENLLEGKRYFLEQEYSLVQKNDSVSYSLDFGHSFNYETKFYQFDQTFPNDYFGTAFEYSNFRDRSNLRTMRNELYLSYNTKTLGDIRLKAQHYYYNYFFKSILYTEAGVITNQLRNGELAVGGSWKHRIGKLDLSADLLLNVSGTLGGSLFNGKARYAIDDDKTLEAGISLSERLPDFNFLLYQSNYIDYNWQNTATFNKESTQRFQFGFLSKKWLNARVDLAVLGNHSYFSEDSAEADPQVQPFQYTNTINYLKIRLEKEFKFGNFALNNTVMYQNVSQDDAIINVPELVTRNTLYYSNHLFKKAMYLQTGITFKYFTGYYANEYSPLLGEFYVQSQREIGNFPLVDIFVNAKIKQTRIYLKAEHFNSGLRGNKDNNFYSAPNYPYRDFIVRFGLVWNFFL